MWTKIVQLRSTFGLSNPLWFLTEASYKIQFNSIQFNCEELGRKVLSQINCLKGSNGV